MTSRIRIAALSLLAGLALSACSPAPETAWRDQVAQAAEQASVGDYAGAHATLITVEQDVTAARDGDRIDTAHAEDILAATAALRADLSILATPAPAPEPTAVEPTPTPDSTTTDGGTDEPSDEDSGADDDSGNSGNSEDGNGNSGSNGNGNNGNGNNGNGNNGNGNGGNGNNGKGNNGDDE